MKLPYEDWWECIVHSRVEGVEGLFVHPVSDPAVMAGNGTIGLEILEELPDVDAVVVPYGGGGLVSGIGSALRARRPRTRIYTVEPETGAALAGARGAGEPVDVQYKPSFIDGSGITLEPSRTCGRVSMRLIDDAWSPRWTRPPRRSGAGATAARDRRGRGRAGKRGRTRGPFRRRPRGCDRVGRGHRFRHPRTHPRRRDPDINETTEPTGEDYASPVLPGSAPSDYERYLRTEELLALQKTPDEWVHRDELLFQTVHQAPSCG